MMTVKFGNRLLDRVRQQIKTAVPDDFAWTFVMDDDLTYRIVYRWKGHRSLPPAGSLSDTNYGVFLGLLQKESWQEKRIAAVAYMQDQESRLLLDAQDVRARRMIGNTVRIQDVPFASQF